MSNNYKELRNNMNKERELIQLLFDCDFNKFKEQFEKVIKGGILNSFHDEDTQRVFFLYFFYSMAALPYTELGKEIKIESIGYKVDDSANNLKVSFKFKRNQRESIKTIEITLTNTTCPGIVECDSEEGFSDLKLNSCDEVANNNYDCDVFDEVTGDTDEEKYTFEGSLEAIKNKKDIVHSIDSMFCKLGWLFNLNRGENTYGYDQEAAQQGFVFGFLMLHYERKYKIDCRAECAAGKGYADLIFLLGNGTKNADPIVVEFKANSGAQKDASKGIEQIKERGYLCNLDIAMKTKSENTIVVGVNFAHDSEKVKVETEKIIRSENIILKLLQECTIQHNDASIKELFKSLYYLIPNTGGSTNRCSMSRLFAGQLLFKECDEQVKKYFLVHDDKNTTFLLKRTRSEGSVIINFIEAPGMNTRSGSVVKRFGFSQLENFVKFPIVRVNVIVDQSKMDFEDRFKVVTDRLSHPEKRGESSKGIFESIKNINVDKLIIDSIPQFMQKLQGVLSEIRELIGNENYFKSVMLGVFTNGKFAALSEYNAYGKGPIDLIICFRETVIYAIAFELKYNGSLKKAEQQLNTYLSNQKIPKLCLNWSSTKNSLTYNKDLSTLFYLAVESDYLELAKALLDKGTNVNAVNEHSDGPLFCYAARYKAIDIVKYLIKERKVSFDIRNDNDCKILLDVISSNCKGIAEILISIVIKDLKSKGVHLDKINSSTCLTVQEKDNKINVLSYRREVVNYLKGLALDLGNQNGHHSLRQVSNFEQGSVCKENHLDNPQQSSSGFDQGSEVNVGGSNNQNGHDLLRRNNSGSVPRRNNASDGSVGTTNSPVALYSGPDKQVSDNKFHVDNVNKRERSSLGTLQPNNPKQNGDLQESDVERGSTIRERANNNLDNLQSSSRDSDSAKLSGVDGDSNSHFQNSRSLLKQEENFYLLVSNSHGLGNSDENYSNTSLQNNAKVASMLKDLDGEKSVNKTNFPTIVVPHVSPTPDAQVNSVNESYNDLPEQNVEPEFISQNDEEKRNSLSGQENSSDEGSILSSPDKKRPCIGDEDTQKLPSVEGVEVESDVGSYKSYKQQNSRRENVSEESYLWSNNTDSQGSEQPISSDISEESFGNERGVCNAPEGKSGNSSDRSGDGSNSKKQGRSFKSASDLPGNSNDCGSKGSGLHNSKQALEEDLFLSLGYSNDKNDLYYSAQDSNEGLLLSPGDSDNESDLHHQAQNFNNESASGINFPVMIVPHVSSTPDAQVDSDDKSYDNPPGQNVEPEFISQNDKEKRNSLSGQEGSSKHGNTSEESTNEDRASSSTKRPRTGNGTTQKPPEKKVKVTLDAEESTGGYHKEDKSYKQPSRSINKELVVKNAASDNHQFRLDQQTANKLVLDGNEKVTNTINEEINDEVAVTLKNLEHSSADKRNDIDGGNTSPKNSFYEDGSNDNAEEEQNKLNTSLFLAVESNNFNEVERLLSKGASINATEEENWTPLHLATRNGHKEVVEALLNKGADVNATEEENWTPLHLAAENGYKEVVEALLNKGADVNATEEENWTPLHLATRNGHKEVVEALLNEGADVNAKNKENWTPLHLATRNGHKEVVEALLNEGADVNAKDDKGCTPLHYAVNTNYDHVIKKLLNYGADINVKDDDGMTPLDFAIKKSNMDIVNLFLNNNTLKDDTKKAALSTVVNSLNTKVIDSLLKENVDNAELLNYLASDKCDITLLYSNAIKFHLINLFEFLLSQKGFDTNAEDENGVMLTSYLHLLRCSTMVNLLQQKGVEIEKGEISCACSLQSFTIDNIKNNVYYRSYSSFHYHFDDEGSSLSISNSHDLDGTNKSYDSTSQQSSSNNSPSSEDGNSNSCFSKRMSNTVEYGSYDLFTRHEIRAGLPSNFLDNDTADQHLQDAEQNQEIFGEEESLEHASSREQSDNIGNDSNSSESEKIVLATKVMLVTINPKRQNSGRESGSEASSSKKSYSRSSSTDSQERKQLTSNDISEKSTNEGRTSSLGIKRLCVSDSDENKQEPTLDDSPRKNVDAEESVCDYQKGDETCRQQGFSQESYSNDSNNSKEQESSSGLPAPDPQSLDNSNKSYDSTSQQSSPDNSSSILEQGNEDRIRMEHNYCKENSLINVQSSSEQQERFSRSSDASENSAREESSFRHSNTSEKSGTELGNTTGERANNNLHNLNNFDKNYSNILLQGNTQVASMPRNKVAQSDSPRQEVKIKSNVGNDESDEQQDSNRESGSEISGSRSNSPDSQEGEQPTLNDVESNSENQEIFSRSSSTSGKNDNDNLSEESCSGDSDSSSDDEKNRRSLVVNEDRTLSSGTKRLRTSNGSTQEPPVKKVTLDDSLRQNVRIGESIDSHQKEDEIYRQQDSDRKSDSEANDSRSDSIGSQFEQLERAKEQQENSQPKSDFCDVSVSGNLTQDFKLGRV